MVYNQDPHYLRDALLYKLTVEAQKRVEASALSKREIIRCLKRYLARELFRLLPAPDAIAKPVNGELEIAA